MCVGDVPICMPCGCIISIIGAPHGLGRPTCLSIASTALSLTPMAMVSRRRRACMANWQGMGSRRAEARERVSPQEGPFVLVPIESLTSVASGSQPAVRGTFHMTLRRYVLEGGFGGVGRACMRERLGGIRVLG